MTEKEKKTGGSVFAERPPESIPRATGSVPPGHCRVRLLRNLDCNWGFFVKGSVVDLPVEFCRMQLFSRDASGNLVRNSNPPFEVVEGSVK